MSPAEFAATTILGSLVLLAGVAWLSLSGQDYCPRCGYLTERGLGCDCQRPSRCGQ